MSLVYNPEALTPAVQERADLIGRARNGDSEAFDALCREHGDRLLRQAVGLCGDVQAAEDLVQDTFVEAWRGLSRYHGGCQFFTWLCSILIHRYRKWLRKRRPFPLSFLFIVERDEAESFLSQIPDPGHGPDGELEQLEQAVRLLRCLAKLPAKQREAVYLRFYAGDSLEGIAAAVGCSVGTVKSRLFNGLERLRRMQAVLKDDDR